MARQFAFPVAYRRYLRSVGKPRSQGQRAFGQPADEVVGPARYGMASSRRVFTALVHITAQAASRHGWGIPSIETPRGSFAGLFQARHDDRRVMLPGSRDGLMVKPTLYVAEVDSAVARLQRDAIPPDTAEHPSASQ